MNNQLGWTTIEQSVKLVEAGLNPESSDMAYFITPERDPKVHCKLYTEMYKEIDDAGIFANVFPCWSFGKLIDLMQDRQYIMNHDSIGNFYKFGTMPPRNHTTSSFDSPIEACIEFIIWLLEQGHIKKVETR